MNISDKIIGAISIVVVTITLLALTPTVVDQVQGMNTSAWNFTGYEGAIALLGLVPFIWVASILISENQGKPLVWKTAVGMFWLAKTPTTKAGNG